MKILHINFSDNYGGAAIAANRHCIAMKKAGIDAKMLVVHQYNNKKIHIHKLISNKFWGIIKEKLNFYIERLYLNCFTPKGTFSYPLKGNSIHNHPLVKEADIIYLHWINHSMLNIKDIENLLKTGKTIYWYMHDMYAITGGCHHSLSCKKYESLCNKCPLLDKNFVIDIAKKQFTQKIKHWSKYKNFKLITPSYWLGSCAKNSAIFKGHDIFICPNPIDTNVYKPINKAVARNIFNLCPHKKTLIFSADNVDNYYKGWEHLKTILNKLDKEQYQCMVLGEYNNKINDIIKIDMTYTGYLHDDYSLMLAYNAADLLIIPSMAENFPNVIVEAMSCGVPCIGFNIGGIPDLIRTGETGYLAKYQDTDDLESGIYYCLKDMTTYNILSKNTRKYIERYCSYKTIEKQYKQLHMN